jgi:hypothetical protein
LAERSGARPDRPDPPSNLFQYNDLSETAERRCEWNTLCIFTRAGMGAGTRRQSRPRYPIGEGPMETFLVLCFDFFWWLKR